MNYKNEKKCLQSTIKQALILDAIDKILKNIKGKEYNTNIILETSEKISNLVKDDINDWK
ncbi:MAG: hypothetical protein ACOCP8_00745 [archaeon]